MGTATPMRTGSFLGSPRGAVSAGAQDSSAGILSHRRSSSTVFSPRACWAAALHLEAESGRKEHFLRRAKSEADLVRSSRLNRAGLQTHAPLRAEEEEADPQVNFHLAVAFPERLRVASVGYSGGGAGKGRKGGGDGRGGEGGNHRGMSDYYQQMLRSDPSNPLLLRNYGRFLHEVEGDAKGAAECYGRAILANPGDGEVLCLYGKLLWEAHGNGERAEAYFERAVEASPDDCYVLGSYAQFLWDAEKEEDEEPTMEETSPLVEAL